MSTRRAPLTRPSIVAAARDLIAEDGLDGLTLRRVGSRLGVSAPALYAHVENKPDLLRAVAELEFEGLMASFEAIEGDDPRDRIRGQMRAYIEHALEDPALFQVMFLFRPGWVPQPAAEELPVASKVFAMGSDAIAEAMQQGAFRPADEFAVAMSLWAAAHGLATLLASGLELGPDLDDQIITTLIDNLLRGLAAD